MEFANIAAHLRYNLHSENPTDTGLCLSHDKKPPLLTGLRI